MQWSFCLRSVLSVASIGRIRSKKPDFTHKLSDSHQILRLRLDGLRSTQKEVAKDYSSGRSVLAAHSCHDPMKLQTLLTPAYLKAK